MGKRWGVEGKGERARRGMEIRGEIENKRRDSEKKERGSGERERMGKKVGSGREKGTLQWARRGVGKVRQGPRRSEKRKETSAGGYIKGERNGGEKEDKREGNGRKEEREGKVGADGAGRSVWRNGNKRHS